MPGPVCFNSASHSSLVHPSMCGHAAHNRPSAVTHTAHPAHANHRWRPCAVMHAPGLQAVTYGTPCTQPAAAPNR
eukprot:5332200-Prymnesium_polylepis.1